MGLKLMKLKRFFLMIGYLTIISFNFILGNLFPVMLNTLFSWGACALAGIRKLVRFVMISLPGPTGQNISLLTGIILVLAVSVLYLSFIQSLNTRVVRRRRHRYPLITFGIHAAGVPVAFLLTPKEEGELFMFEPLFLFLAGVILAAFYVFLDWRLARRGMAAAGQHIEKKGADISQPPAFSGFCP